MENKEYSLGIRLYHWLNALTIMGIVLTIFTRKEWLEKFKVRDIIIEFAQKHAIVISHEDALKLAKMIRNEIWDFHYYLGIFLAILIVFRLVLAFTPSGRRIFTEGFSVFKKEKAKRAGIKLLYTVVYIVLLILIVTGLGMYFYQELGFTKEFKHALEGVHVGFVSIIIYFIPLHLVGVILAEIKDEPGLISRMIHGNKDSKE